MKTSSVILISLSTLALAIPKKWDTKSVFERASGEVNEIVGEIIPRAASPCTNALTDELLFTDSMSTFTAARNAENPSCFVWSSDDCSKSPDHPDGYNFVPSCRRHDFGYRNMKKEGRLTEDMRKRVDDNLKSDLYNECKQYSGWESWKGVECRRIADIYYAFVRACGDGDCLD